MRHEKCLDKCFAWLTNAESDAVLPFRSRTLLRRTYQAAIRRPPGPGTFVMLCTRKSERVLRALGFGALSPNINETVRVGQMQGAEDEDDGSLLT